MAARFAAALDALAPGGRLALAVSGGADSLALLLLADGWTRAAPDRRLYVLTVDHGLRPESARETGAVAAQATALGHDHAVLRPNRPLPRRGLEAAARACRYELMAAWCRAAAVPALATGHTLDDQAETLLMRLERGSGLDGLSAMAPETRLGDIRLLRPLLGFRRAETAALVARAGLHAADDPMNHDPAFERVRIRRAMTTLGLDAEGLAATADRLRRDRAAIETLVDDLVRRAFTLSPAGVGGIEVAALRGTPAPLVERALARLIRAVGGGAYPPRRDRLDRLAALIAGDGDFPGATLGGCRFLPGRGHVRVLREARRLGPDLELGAGAAGVWDGRFAVVAGAQPVTIAALGAHRPQGLPALPAAERQVLPAVFSQGRLIAVPTLEFGTPQAARLRYCAPSMFSA
ncbi:tRNA lysidine(34) synthetase TilS [Zavarzinia aquatilis]|uniref:tRNA lysidine(34) synthetase TilS n=1 Tax=Zavarzinia aquatilis TaxID=2211142 RepID=UPI001403885C|nr:tRNA lysidine(34) synthetase TilS [Zavarzinia aquatilis]